MNTAVKVALVFVASLASATPDNPEAVPGSNVGSGPCTLLIHVAGFRNTKGRVGGTVFTSPNGWPEDNKKSFAHAAFPIDGNHATLTFHLPAGRYAVAVLHDENSNRKLDRNFLGIPKEGFGFANNPRVALKAPDWQAAAVNVACPATEIDIRLIYK